jgi:hypothetical protein
MSTEDADTPSLEVQIVEFLRHEQPYSYCDACLAFTLRLDVNAIREAAISIAKSFDGYKRLDALCDQCDRIVTVTCAA